MHNQLVTVCFLILAVMVCVSCSTTHTNFDTSTYIDPAGYGYDRELNKKNSEQTSNDSDFIPISVLSGYEAMGNAFQAPQDARRSGRGKTVLKLYVDSTGTLQRTVTVISGDRAWTRAFLNVIHLLKFKPATLNGKPVNSFAFLPFEYRTTTRIRD